MMTSPTPPSRARTSPSLTPMMPVAFTMAGIPSWAARIAVCEVGPPTSVMMPLTVPGSRVAVSAGARSWATRITSPSSAGTPGSGRPRSSLVARSRTS